MHLPTSPVPLLGSLAGTAYDVGMGKGQWGELTDAIAASFDTVQTVITTDVADIGTGPIEGVDYLSARAICTPYDGEDFLIERAWRMPRGDISLMQRMHENPAVAATGFYRHRLASVGLAHTIHVMLPVSQERVAFFCMTRDSSQPVFSDDELDVVRALLPHVSRALQLSERLAAPARPTLFDAMPYGIIFLDGSGKVRDMNRAARQIVTAGDGISAVNGSLRLPGNRLEFVRFIADSLDELGQVKPVAFQIDRAMADRPLSALLAPVPPDWKRTLEADAIAAVLILSDPLRPTYPDTQVLIDQYGLTNSEARFAQTLVRSRSLKPASIELGISQETARRHVKSIFEKTLTHSQSELIHLLVRHPSAIFSGLDLDFSALDLRAAAE